MEVEHEILEKEIVNHNIVNTDPVLVFMVRFYHEQKIICNPDHISLDKV